MFLNMSVFVLLCF